MKHVFFLLAVAIFSVSLMAQSVQQHKLIVLEDKIRIVISTDFPPLDVCISGCPEERTSDPDDVQSMVRFLLYSNEFDVEGLVASSATYANIARKQNILDILNLYDKVDENLRKHKSGYPTANYLRSVTFQGLSGTYGKPVINNIGEVKDSEASEAIIKIIDKSDSRPVWFCIWGDCSNLAQAVWKIQHTRSAGELQIFLSKIRIFQIDHQDDTIDWLMENFPKLSIDYCDVPLHPGVIKFYRELGLKIPEKLIPPEMK